jgi:hypothetical protein
VPQSWRARSGRDGRFTVAAAPAVERAAVQAVLAGFAPHVEDAPQQSTAALEIFLQRPGTSPGLVRGVVLDAAGARAEKAHVSAGGEIATTDAFGEFALNVRSEGARDRLIALKPGLLPAIFTPEKDAHGQPQWPAEVVLQLGGAAGAVAGRVVDAAGRPVAGARVWLADPTPFGRSSEARLVAESLLRGDERFWSYEVTAGDGTFAMRGLLPRAYRLEVLDPRTLVRAACEAVTADGPPLEIRLPTGDTYERVAGRVVTKAGQPVGGARVRVFRVTYELAHESGTDNEVMESEAVITAGDGAFEFRNVAKHGVQVIATGDTILGAAAAVDEQTDPARVEVVASLRLHFQVDLRPPTGRADRLRVFDAGGGRVFLSVFRGNGAHADFEMPILDGRSAVLSVDERAATLVLYRGEQEVARVPLHLAPGTTNRVRY